MKLAEWCRMAGVLPTHPTTERGAVSLCWTPPNPPDSDSLAWDLHHLDDYKVSSRSGPVVWLVPVLEEGRKESGEHEHQWGPLESSRLAGTVHRKCQVPGCNVIDAYDEDED